MPVTFGGGIFGGGSGSGGSGGGVSGSGVAYRLAIWSSASALTSHPGILANASNGVLTIGAQSDVVPMTLRAYSSGTSHILQWQNSGNQPRGEITHDGALRIYSTASTGVSDYERASLSVTAGAGVVLAAETAGTGADDLDVVISPAGTGVIVSDRPANQQWLSLRYVASEYLKFGYVGGLGYGFGAGSVYGGNEGFGVRSGTPFVANSLTIAANNSGVAAIVTADAPDVLAQRNGTSAQALNIYGTYTDASNYVRASLAATSAAVTLAAETAGTGADDVPVNITPAGAGQTVVSSNLVLPKASGQGIKVDTASPTFGWHDIIGDVRPKTAGAGTPTLSTFRGGNVQMYSFAVNDIIDFTFHIPHDYLPGSDLYWHLHWGHNGTTITGNFTVQTYVTYAKGHNQAAFPAEKTITVTYATVDIATTPRYQHRIDEVQMSTPGGSATLLDSSAIEIDGLILVRCKVTAIPTITGGSPNNPFIFMGDVHYQSTALPSKQKAPNFYT